MIEIVFYKTLSGNCPIEDFLESLSSQQVRKVIWVLELIQSQDPIPALYLKKLVGTEDIWEVRVQLGGDIFRLLGFLDSQQLILTNGFAKKTQKTPAQEIEKAEQRKKEYFSRKDKR